jgi:hypothetical protein
VVVWRTYIPDKDQSMDTMLDKAPLGDEGLDFGVATSLLLNRHRADRGMTAGPGDHRACGDRCRVGGTCGGRLQRVWTVQRALFGVSVGTYEKR